MFLHYVLAAVQSACLKSGDAVSRAWDGIEEILTCEQAGLPLMP